MYLAFIRNLQAVHGSDETFNVLAVSSAKLNLGEVDECKKRYFIIPQHTFPQSMFKLVWANVRLCYWQLTRKIPPYPLKDVSLAFLHCKASPTNTYAHAYVCMYADVYVGLALKLKQSVIVNNNSEYQQQLSKGNTNRRTKTTQIKLEMKTI